MEPAGGGAPGDDGDDRRPEHGDDGQSEGPQDADESGANEAGSESEEDETVDEQPMSQPLRR
jgi:hypothetical protein